MAYLDICDNDLIDNFENETHKETPLHLRQHIDIFNPRAPDKNEVPDTLPELSDGESTASHRRSNSLADSIAPEATPTTPVLTPTSFDKKTDSSSPDGLLNFSKQSNQELDEVVRAPYEYIAALPQKSFRTELIYACNAWYDVSAEQCTVVARVVGMLHNASLMIDDIQDGSDLRRGEPVAHSIFGVAQTLNSANFIYFQAQAELSKLFQWEDAVKAFEEELLCLHRGQGMELYYRDTFTQPTMDQYLQMVSDKTGGLFRLIGKLLKASSNHTEIDLVPLLETTGLIFQILDDCKNLLDDKMAEQKGYCEDLTEGKFSFPIVHALSTSSRNSELLNILKARTTDNAVKAFVVRHLRQDTGSFGYAKRILEQLHQHARCLLEGLSDSSDAKTTFEQVLNKLREHERKAFAKYDQA